MNYIKEILKILDDNEYHKVYSITRLIVEKNVKYKNKSESIENRIITVKKYLEKLKQNDYSILALHISLT